MNINCLPDNLLENIKYICNNSNEEVCGFVKKNEQNNYVFYKCCNIHPDPIHYFLICKNDYLNNLDGILFHSHSVGGYKEGFSDWDLENQKFHCFDMLLYSVNNNKFYYKEYGEC